MVVMDCILMYLCLMYLKRNEKHFEGAFAKILCDLRPRRLSTATRPRFTEEQDRIGNDENGATVKQTAIKPPERGFWVRGHMVIMTNDRFSFFTLFSHTIIFRGILECQSHEFINISGLGSRIYHSLGIYIHSL